MILVTVGAQMPFDRLIQGVDRWARERERADVLAQVGPSSWKPEYISWVEFISPAEFREKIEAANVVIAHAGMGSILTALELGKPVLVMPRRGDLRETRNDHQVATARQLLAQGRVSVAFDEQELMRKLDELDRLPVAQKLQSHASPELLSCLRNFIWRQTHEEHNKA